MDGHAHHKGRSEAIDLLRGLAVLGMIVAHAIFFFHDQSNPLFIALAGFLNSVVITVFVFVYGSSLSRWLDTYANIQSAHMLHLSLRRTALFYLVYVLASLFALIAANATDFNTFFGALTLSHPPSFTEYIPLFLLFSLFTPFLRPLLRYTRASLLLTFIIGAFSYLLGITILELEFPSAVINYFALFAGGEGLLRFPFFFYFPVLVWGLWWQHDIDHNKQDSQHTKTHFAIMLTMVLITVASALLSNMVNIPLLNPAIRWPPSISYLTFGLAIAQIGFLLTPIINHISKTMKRLIAYFGRDALDVWTSHILLLFLYQKFIGFHFTNPYVVLLLILVLLVTTILCSSLTVTNNIKFPIHVLFSGTTRFRKRYILYTSLALITLIVTNSLGNTSLYGNFMPSNPITIRTKYPADTSFVIHTKKHWFIKHENPAESIELALYLPDLSPEEVEVSLNNQIQNFASIKANDGTVHFSKPISDLSPGIYELTAAIDNGDSTLTSNKELIYISEPLLVAWTFDWEGWDAPDAALEFIDNLATYYPSITFTHFVNPRMFISEALPENRKEKIKTYLQTRQAKGDELGLHLHMHFDLVQQAGVATTSAGAWGLRSDEGYDVPTSSYSVDEFSQIVQFAQSIANDFNLIPMNGYRAGGFYLTSDQLNILHSLGFSYDSSGRSKPATGAFANTPWNLVDLAQPYYPSSQNQNIPSAYNEGILEIPINGLTTYDQTIEQLIFHAKTLYPGGVLYEPKILVYVSHPQFFSREFGKIMDVLNHIASISYKADKGPALFTTTGSIEKLWKTLH